jgi:hypothetical protein
MQPASGLEALAAAGAVSAVAKVARVIVSRVRLI